MSAPSALDRDAIATARILAADAVERAGSGHPGTAIALAPVADRLFQRHLRHDPAHPDWAGRDRFVLSCGHASILLYTQLHLTGYELGIEDLRSFRRLGSATPGHPEYGHTPGVETTTGPLGQGIATAVGMAMAMKHERALYDPSAPEGESPFDRTVWVIASDGDLQEGLSYEAGALAGHHALDNLVVVFDDNDIQIEGAASLSTSEDIGARFAAQGWRVERVALAADGDVDIPALDDALEAPRDGRPTLVMLRSQIAWPAPNAVNTAASHGAPLGAAEVSELRDALGYTREPFDVAPDVYAHTRRALTRGQKLRAEWTERDAEWRAREPECAAEHDRVRRGGTPVVELPSFEPGTAVSTRDASGKAISALATAMPELWGGSADLAEPNRTAILGGGSFLPGGGGDRAGRNIHWGVREHAMASAMNGFALVGGVRPFAGTFLVFSDYQRPAIRLAALMGLPVTYIWSHDSVALGADGPTHQPIEHLASLRAIPGFSVVRPADGNETVAAWSAMLERRRPAGLVLGRQPVPVLDIAANAVAEGTRRGAYVVREVEDPAAVIVATGSEVALALETAEAVEADGIRVRVVSMPCREWFEEQPAEYRESVLPAALTARVVVEAASRFGWADIAGSAGAIVSIDDFGLSAPAEDALREKGMTVARVRAALASVL